jgi:hypothetical protein
VRARVRALRRFPILAAFLGLVAAAVLVSACGSSSTTTTSTVTQNLNTAHDERAIEKSIRTKRHLNYHVTCPPLVPIEQGRVFECVANGRNAKHKRESTTFVVTIQNNRGYVTYVGK